MSPPDKMNTSTLQSAWNARTQEIKTQDKIQKLQAASSKLYTRMIAEMEPELPYIQSLMKDACQTAQIRGQLQVPIWTFKTRYFLQTRDEEIANLPDIMEYLEWKSNRDREIDVRGYHYCTDGIPDRVIFRETDLLDRLTARLFGTTHFKIKMFNTADDVDTELNVIVVTRRLFLHFYPNGITEEDRAQLQAAVWKYQPTSPLLTSTPPTLPPPTPIRPRVSRRFVGLPPCFCCTDDDDDTGGDTDDETI